jgi:hypothetical protein
LAQSKEEAAAVRKRWYEENKAKHAADGKAWREKNKEKVAATNKTWQVNNREKVRADAKEWRAANSDLVTAYNTKWWQNNLAKALQTRMRASLKANFGITLEFYFEMLEAQKGVCFVCKQTCKTGRRLAVDHCHATGRIRGLLCHACNCALGRTNDDPEILRGLANYLERPDLQHRFVVRKPSKNE